MGHNRHKALEKLTASLPKDFQFSSKKISDYFEEDCFGLERMRELLSKEDFKAIDDAIKNGKKVNEATANAIAVCVKNWALSRGATHFAHWFQPLTGGTAMKHDTFFDKYAGIEMFKGSVLVQQEPDASSFPNGGIRGTHFARGYTGWDPTSPMFIYSNTLFVPTVFISYTGEMLDYKAPLLKAQRAVDDAATAVCQYFDASVEKVNSSLGCEQEYFVIDKALFQARPDLMLTGRTVLGAPSPKHQQLDDHYFGSIPNKVLSFMKQFEQEAHRLGIPVTTRHNEVAPGQYEVAPIFEDINVASDHNMMVMKLMDKVADEHGLAVLFHEKPFAGINGNGKHNNWSLITTGGKNLLDPQLDNEEDGLYFVTFLVNTLKAVHEQADLLRASIASAGNDHRLGANEAPPAIISAFLGEVLTEVLDHFEKTGKIKTEGKKALVPLGIERIPHLTKDNTDRNRTSPFAFTGNKFEFRAVGSTANCGLPMMVLNTIVADQLISFKSEVDALIKKGEKKKAALTKVIKQYIKDTKAVRFEGDGYGEAWVKEAKKRGLSNVKDTPRALAFFKTPKAKAIFKRSKVLSPSELDARVEIWWEIYATKIEVEAKIMHEMVGNKILPVVVDYQNALAENAAVLADVGVSNKGGLKLLEQVAALMDATKDELDKLCNKIEKAEEIEDVQKKALFCGDQLKADGMDKLRPLVDGLEQLVDDELWPIPKFRELLFIK